MEQLLCIGELLDIRSVLTPEPETMKLFFALLSWNNFELSHLVQEGRQEIIMEKVERGWTNQNDIYANIREENSHGYTVWRIGLYREEFDGIPMFVLELNGAGAPPRGYPFEIGDCFLFQKGKVKMLWTSV